MYLQLAVEKCLLAKLAKGNVSAKELLLLPINFLDGDALTTITL